MPAGESTYDLDEQLEMADEALQTVILPDIISVREEFFITYKDYSITADQAEYEIPVRAVGSAPREIQIVSDGGSVDSNIPRVTIERLKQTTTGTPSSFYLRDDKDSSLSDAQSEG